MEIQVGSRIGSLKNMKHQPGGGDKKIFDDKDYLKQMGEVGMMTRSGSSSLTGSTWDSSTLVDERNAPKTLNFTQSKSKKSFSSPGSSYQSQVLRKLVSFISGKNFETYTFKISVSHEQWVLRREDIEVRSEEDNYMCFFNLSYLNGIQILTI